MYYWQFHWSKVWHTSPWAKTKAPLRRWCLLDLLSGGSGENPHLCFFQFLQVSCLPQLRAPFLRLQSQQGLSLWPLFPSQIFADRSWKRFSLLRMDVIRVGPLTWQLRETSPSQIHDLVAIHRFWVLGCGHLWGVIIQLTGAADSL